MTLQCERPYFDIEGVRVIAEQYNRRLKLKVYRSLGIDIQADGVGNYNRAVIRNNHKGDVHVISVDAKFSRFFYSNLFWQTMQ